MKDDIKKRLRTQMNLLLHFFKCLIRAGADRPLHSFPKYFFGLIFFSFFFLPFLQMKRRERLFFLLHAGKLYKEVFDL